MFQIVTPPFSSTQMYEVHIVTIWTALGRPAHCSLTPIGKGRSYPSTLVWLFHMKSFSSILRIESQPFRQMELDLQCMLRHYSRLLVGIRHRVQNLCLVIECLVQSFPVVWPRCTGSCLSSNAASLSMSHLWVSKQCSIHRAAVVYPHNEVHRSVFLPVVLSFLKEAKRSWGHVLTRTCLSFWSYNSGWSPVVSIGTMCSADESIDWLGNIQPWKSDVKLTCILNKSYTSMRLASNKQVTYWQSWILYRSESPPLNWKCG